MQKNSSGSVHALPSDMHDALSKNSKAHHAWENLTPLARNEWICWVISVKREETRKEHVARLIEDMIKGKRRPCCWIGCIHRKDKKISPSIQGILAKQSSSSRT